MIDNKPKIIVITGPTASGKSSLAIDLAQFFQGEIVNADSMQVYCGMNIGTAKPSLDKRRGIPHHLIDVVQPDEEFNASIYRALAVPILKKVTGEQRACFVVGGTGLYIKTLLGGLLECPPSEPALREKLYIECKEHGSSFLHDRLKLLDPEYAWNIHPNDKTRVVRALEIIHLSNQPLSLMIRKHGFRQRTFKALKICLQMNREQLYHRINDRSLSMINEGLIEETQNLLTNGYSPDLKAMKSLGYRHAVRFLDKVWDLEETIRQLQADTRRYAKRQLTWFRADPEMVWVEPGDRSSIKEMINTFI